MEEQGIFRKFAEQKFQFRKVPQTSLKFRKSYDILIKTNKGAVVVPKTSEWVFNARRRLFALEYVKTADVKQAAICAGFSEKTAASKGNQLLAEPEVRGYIDELLDKIGKEVVKEPEILRFFSDVMRGNEKDVTYIKELGVAEEVPCTIATKMRAAENLAKILGMFSEKLSIENSENNKFKIEIEVV